MSDDGLSYLFLPTPHWVMEHARTAKLSPDEFLLISFLYDRADWGRLRRREPTPRMTLRQLMDALPLDISADGVSKRLRRLKERGYFGWKIERLPGRPSKGRDVYVFELSCDGPFGHPDGPSSVRDVSASARPSRAGGQDRLGSGTAEPTRSDTSEFEPSSTGEVMAELPVDLSEFSAAATPLAEPVSVADASPGWPSSSDVQSTPNPSRTGTTDVGERVDVARTREDARFVPEVREAIERARFAAVEANPRPADDVLASLDGLRPEQQRQVQRACREAGLDVGDPGSPAPPTGSVKTPRARGRRR